MVGVRLRHHRFVGVAVSPRRRSRPDHGRAAHDCATDDRAAEHHYDCAAEHHCDCAAEHHYDCAGIRHDRADDAAELTLADQSNLSAEYFINFCHLWVASMVRMVPDFERITIDCVLAPLPQ